MNFLFGKPKQPSASQPSAPSNPQGGVNSKDALVKVRDTIETVGKRRAHIDRKIQAEQEKAKTFMKQNKKKEALQCVKRKKMYEKQLDTLDATQLTLETQMASLEGMNINMEVLEANKLAAKTMESQIKSQGGIDEVENVMDAVEEGLQDAQEVAEVMARTVGDVGDEDDLMGELEGLMEDETAKELGKVSISGSAAAVDMPSAPISLPAAPQRKVGMTDEEKELAELEAAMS